ncbi:hypothetical protein [Clostridium scatologenes]|uniref:DUF2178 domain-containing protein n=1 Tax=Clostridium scatologenes TaxID=1548 RepID=A0A0E3GQ17_CLOSL|nr:hypothetical protein [Clostridium scatologenes]AKA67791.1 hypothetical protein CSCA_0666 [Clostridium scatologenes]
MNIRKISGLIFGISALVIISFTIYKIVSGKIVGFSEISSIGIVMMAFFSTITWGNKEKDDGIRQEEELGKKITEESSKISYLLITVFIFITVLVDKFLNGNSNINLLVLLMLSMITLPFVEFIISKKYQ